MIMHIWMHWFWITTSYLKAFLLFTAQTISFSCIPQAVIAEAGLLENHTFASVIPKYYKDDSSQLGDDDPSVSSPSVTEQDSRASETTPRHLGPREDPATEGSGTPETEDALRTASGSAGDLQDTYNGETLDVFQYPLKKHVKYSHLKYGKVKTKGKPNSDTGGDERKLEPPKVVAENVDGSASAAEHSELEVDDKSSDGLSAGSTTALPTSDAPDLTVTTAEEGLGGPGGLGDPGDPPPAPGPASAGNASSGPSAAAEVPEVGGPGGGERSEVQRPRNESLMIENKVEERGPYTTEEPSAMKNRVAASTSAQNYEVRESELNVGSITGITLGILVVFTLLGAVSFVLYRRRYLNKPQVLHDKCSNLDSSGYIDETSLRENSEEMYSLDNDSFLNSLEAMTIQNYWTENVKHTKL